MRVPVRVLALLAFAAVASQPASACEMHQANAAQLQPHDHSVDRTETSTVKLDPEMAGDLELRGAWARAMLPGQPAGVAFLTISNRGAEDDRLLSATSPSAGRVELHIMKVEDDVMVMRPVDDGLELPADATVALEPGGLHLMFLDPAEPFAEGDWLTVTLTFEKAGPVEIEIPVRKTGPAVTAHTN